MTMCTEKYVEICLYTYEKYKSRMNVYLQMHLNTSLINFYPQISNLQETFYNKNEKILRFYLSLYLS